MKAIKLSISLAFLLIFGLGSAFAETGAYFFPVTPKDVMNDHSNGSAISIYSAWRPDAGILNKESDKVAGKEIITPVCTAYLCLIK